MKKKKKLFNFTLIDVRGGNVNLYEILNKKRVLIIFYRGGWCPICNKQLLELSKNYDKFKKLNVEILAISNEEVKKGQKILKKIGPPFPLLSDIKSEVIKRFHLLVTKRDPLGLILMKHNYAHPAVYLIGKDNNLQWFYKGKTYRDRPSLKIILEAIKKNFL